MVPYNTVTIVGNVTRDPELRFTNKDVAVTNFAVAWNNKHTKSSGETIEEVLFLDVVCWGMMAENVSESIYKGDRVVIFGYMGEKKWKGRDGEERKKIQITADEVAPSLRYATAEIEKRERPHYD